MQGSVFDDQGSSYVSNGRLLMPETQGNPAVVPQGQRLELYSRFCTLCSKRGSVCSTAQSNWRHRVHLFVYI